MIYLKMPPMWNWSDWPPGGASRASPIATRMEHSEFTMSLDGKKNKMANVTDQRATLASAPTSGPIELESAALPRLRNLSALLKRENVQAVIYVGDVRAFRITAKFDNGSTDNKTIDMGAGLGRSIAIVLLDDNPENVGGGFYEVKSPMPVSDKITA